MLCTRLTGPHTATDRRVRVRLAFSTSPFPRCRMLRSRSRPRRSARCPAPSVAPAIRRRKCPGRPGARSEAQSGAGRAAGRAMPGKWQGALLLLQHCLPTAPRFPPRKRGRARRGGPADNFRPACRARHRACLGAVDAIAASRVARRHKPLAKRRPIFPAKLLPRERKLSKQTTRTGAQADDTKVWRRKAGSARPLEALSERRRGSGSRRPSRCARCSAASFPMDANDDDDDAEDGLCGTAARIPRQQDNQCRTATAMRKRRFFGRAPHCNWNFIRVAGVCEAD